LSSLGRPKKFYPDALEAINSLPAAPMY